MGILLTVLKIIGIILLVILGIILLAIAVLLFAPLRYEVQIRREQQSMEPLLQISVTWLLRLMGISAWLYLPVRWGAKVRAVRWTLLRMGDAEENQPSREAASEDKTEAEQEAKAEVLARQEPAEKGHAAEEQKVPIEPKQTDAGKQAEPLETVTQPVKAATAPEEKASPRFGGLWQKIRLGERLSSALDALSALPGKLIDLVTGLIFALQDGEDALDDWVSAQQKKLNKFTPFLTTESKNWYNKVLKNFRRCVWHYRPRRWKGYIYGGTGSADTTAIVAGLFYRLIPEAGGAVEIRPDFDVQTLETSLDMCGRIRACHLVWFGIKVLVDRDSWRMLRRVRPKKKKGE